MERDRALDAWLAGLPPTAPPAILLGIGSTNDLSVLRRFARRGIPTLHLVSQRLLGSFSRFGCRVRMPPVEHEPEVWLAALARPLTDEHCELLSRNAERLRAGSLRFVVPDGEAFGRIVDKRLQYTAAEAYPVILKPSPRTSAGRGSGTARSSWSRHPTS